MTADEDLVTLLIAEPAGHHPSEWNEHGVFLAVMNEAPVPKPELVADYVIDSWEDLANAQISDEDD